MTEQTQAPQNFQDLQARFPAEAALLQTVVTTAVKEVEHHMADLPGDKKKELAEQQAIELLQKVYDGVDMWLDFKPYEDFLAKECLIPLIPKAIDGIVALFNQIGTFLKGLSGGVS
jgi:hypothetical protein